MNPLPGFRDFYPEALALRRHIFEHWRAAARRFGFREYDGPPLEPLELYTQKSGAEIVSQLFNFVDKGERAVALRPEMTPTLARMVGARHRDYRKPLKWFAIPQVFRYEKQQRGRLREHFQFNADIIGSPELAADAELIALAIDSLRSFGLSAQDIVVRVSDRRAWQDHFARLGIPADKQYAVFQAIDKLEREPLERTREKLGSFAEPVLAFANQKDPQGDLGTVFEQLGPLAAFCETDFKIVRGLAYYTGIVWEIHDRRGVLRAIAGGGRYDNLLKQISGIDLPALGFGLGDVTMTELLKECGKLPQLDWGLDAYVVIADESLRRPALDLIQQLRTAGVAIDYALAETKVGKQFQAASALGARFAVVVGAAEWGSGQVKLKNLATGEERHVARTELVDRLK